MSDTRTTTTGYEALKTGAAIVFHPGKTIFRLIGKDPAGMLNAILTNDMPEDKSLGTYALLLNPKGRIQTDLRALKDGEDILIITEPEGADAAQDILGRYAPFSRVKVEGAPMSILGLYGPRAKELLDLELAEHEGKEVEIGGAKVLAVGVAVPAPGCDLIVPEENLAPVRDHLLNLGATRATTDDYETVRIEAGVPRFGADITPENFPNEAGILDRAVSFQKGCYPGQETVARTHYRGQPNKNLHRFVIEGEALDPETSILQNEKEVGKITSVAPLPVNGETFALGYLKRKAAPEGDLRAGNARLAGEGLC
ncbi:MAG: YgfZ/GcvT domain-containing protein [Rubrobacteraceae bacterium]